MNAHVPLKEAARGKWRDILAEIGIAPKFLSGKNGPCPLCGTEKKHFRFIDSDGNGTWICHSCSGDGGSGVELVKRFLGVDFKDACRKIEPLIGQARAVAAKPPFEAGKLREKLVGLWRASKPICDGDLASRYLAGRGCWPIPFESSALRFAPAVWHSESKREWPCLLAVVCDAAGKPSTLHRTWLAEDGSGKAPVDPPRAVMPGSMPRGYAVRLGPAAPKMGVGEGVETCISAAILSGFPVWPALNAGGVKGFEVPEGVEELVIFADNDSHFAGQAAAYALANRIAGKVRVNVAMPGTTGWDWNDILLARKEAA